MALPLLIEPLVGETPTLARLETPAAIVDLRRVRRNVARVTEYCGRSGLQWRPHVKTHKVPALALEEVRAGACGVSVATLRELEVMSPLIDDILLAYPIIGPVRSSRLERLGELARLSVALDSSCAIDTVRRVAGSMGRHIGVLVEIDVGAHRLGVQTPEEVVRLASEVARHGRLSFEGVMFYPGHIRSPLPQQTSALAALSSTIDQYLDALTAAGLPVGTVSGGSTPTIWRSHEIAGLTEVRAGTLIFNDRTSVALGVCDHDECAYTILSTVISTAVPEQATIDAGSKALSSDTLRGDGTGFGAVLGHPDIVVRALSEEHGMLDLSNTAWRPRVGDLVRIVPNHVCTSVNLQEVLHFLEGDDYVGHLAVSGRGRAPG